MKTIRMWVGDEPYPEGKAWATMPKCRTNEEIKAFNSKLQYYYDNGFHVNIYSLGKDQLALLEDLRKIALGLYANGLEDKISIHLHEEDPQMRKFIEDSVIFDCPLVIGIK